MAIGKIQGTVVPALMNSELFFVNLNLTEAVPSGPLLFFKESKSILNLNVSHEGSLKTQRQFHHVFMD